MRDKAAADARLCTLGGIPGWATYYDALQGIAVGQLPLRQDWDVHTLLVRLVVPATVSRLLAHVQVNSTRSPLWRVAGAVL